MQAPDLTAIDWKRYGVAGELPRLLSIVEKRRTRHREAWQARDAAKAAVASTNKDARELVEAAIEEDADELPHTATLRADRERALESAQDVVKAGEVTVKAAEREVAMFCAQEGAAALEAVEATLDADRAKALELAAELVYTIERAAEAAALVEAIRDADPRKGMPRLRAPAAFPAAPAVRELIPLIEQLEPRPVKNQLAEVTAW